MQDRPQEKPTIELRSTEVREILSKPPHALLLYGTGIICVILTLLIAGSFFFSYPDIISGKVVVYKDSTHIAARVHIPVKGSGKVKPGQQVNIKLDAYPYMEFGLLQGEVKSVQEDFDPDFAVVEVLFSQNTQTTHKKTINFDTQMSGSADIITENRKLIERIFSPIKYFFEKTP
jgi:hypothetical protein